MSFFISTGKLGNTSNACIVKNVSIKKDVLEMPFTKALDFLVNIDTYVKDISDKNVIENQFQDYFSDTQLLSLNDRISTILSELRKDYIDYYSNVIQKVKMEKSLSSGDEPPSEYVNLPYITTLISNANPDKTIHAKSKDGKLLPKILTKDEYYNSEEIQKGLCFAQILKEKMNIDDIIITKSWGTNEPISKYIELPSIITLRKVNEIIRDDGKKEKIEKDYSIMNFSKKSITACNEDIILEEQKFLKYKTSINNKKDNAINPFSCGIFNKVTKKTAFYTNKMSKRNISVTSVKKALASTTKEEIIEKRKRKARKKMLRNAMKKGQMIDFDLIKESDLQSVLNPKEIKISDLSIYNELSSIYDSSKIKGKINIRIPWGRI